MSRQPQVLKQQFKAKPCKQLKLQLARQNLCRASKHPISRIKKTSSPIKTGAGSSYTNSNLVSVGWPGTRKITKEGEAASIKYLTNALGQRTFKGEPKAEQRKNHGQIKIGKIRVEKSGSD